MERELMRIGVSMNNGLLKRFDDILEKSGRPSRSEGIREAIIGYIQYYEWMNELEGERIGVISIVYEQAQHGVLNGLINAHDSGRVMSAVDLPIDRENYIEMVALKDDGRNVKELAEKIMALKGIKHVKLTTIKP
jgi:CopG family transcriptional regulator, nickel-responsive regulator